MKNSYEASHDMSDEEIMKLETLSPNRFYDENGVEVYHTAEQERAAMRECSPTTKIRTPEERRADRQAAKHDFETSNCSHSNEISDAEVEELSAQLILENLILENLLKHSLGPLPRWEALNTVLQADIRKHKRIIAELKQILEL
jgi:hypothetical protein